MLFADHRLEKAAGFMCVDSSGLVLSASGVARESCGPFATAGQAVYTRLRVDGKDAPKHKVTVARKSYTHT
jgi:hypothetical protein